MIQIILENNLYHSNAKKEITMKKVITYGTFDLFHDGHFKLLERAKKLGDYLIVGVTTESYDNRRGKLNVKQNLMERIENVKKTCLADEIIIEEEEGQKITDILKYNINIFAIGSDWIGKFDYLNEYCKVCYLDRTKGISSTFLRNEANGIIKLGMIGYGRIATRFLKESKFVSGVNIESIYGLNEQKLQDFKNLHEINNYSTDFNSFLESVDAVYIASPHLSHYEYVKKTLMKGKHVLCEKPLTLSSKETEEVYLLAKSNNCVLLEAIKTAFAPGFIRLISIAKSGLIGNIKNIDVTFTKLESGDLRELKEETKGGSVTELISYPLLAIFKLMGLEFIDLSFYSFMKNDTNVDLFTKVNILYKNGICSAKIGLGVKSEGDLVISGTKGYIYVPSPWWKTEYFEIRYENFNENRKHFYKFEADGLRYELSEFISMINNNELSSFKLLPEESVAMAKVIEKFLNKEKFVEIE